MTRLPKLVRTLQRSLGKRLARLLPPRAARAFVVELAKRDPQTTIGAVARFVKSRALDLDRMPFDLAPAGPLNFEHLAGLFASTTLDEGIISMNIRQSAYLFGLVRAMAPARVVEIGRYKGGSTLVIAAAMRGRGHFWSIDVAGGGARAAPTRRESSDSDPDRGRVPTLGTRSRGPCRRFADRRDRHRRARSRFHRWRPFLREHPKRLRAIRSARPHRWRGTFRRLLRRRLLRRALHGGRGSSRRRDR